MEREIIISNSSSEIAKITQFIEELSLSLQLSSCVTMSINLAIEEAIINIINHAYPTSRKGEIVLRVKVSSQVLTFLIIDDGISFDPIQAGCHYVFRATSHRRITILPYSPYDG